MPSRHAVLQALSLPGVLAIGGFFRPEFIAFAPFLAFGTLDSERRWMRVISRVGLAGFVGSFATIMRLLHH